jgi:hypothetical protein
LGLLALVLAACSGDADEAQNLGPGRSVTSQEASSIVAAGPATRAAGPLQFRSVLTSEVVDGIGSVMATEGMFDAATGRSTIQITSEVIGDRALTDNEAAVLATAAGLADTVISVAIDGDSRFVRVDPPSDGEQEGWYDASGGGSGDLTTEGGIAVLRIGLSARPNEAVVVGEEVINGVATTHYLVPSDAGELAIYVPRITVDRWVDNGFSRNDVDDVALVDMWIDEGGVIHRVLMDLLPLVRAAERQGAIPPGVYVGYELDWTLLDRGEGVVIEIPELSEVSG